MANTNSVNWTAIGAIAAVLAIVIPIGAYVFYIERRISSLEEKLGDIGGKTQHISLHHDNHNITLIKARSFTYGFSDQGFITINEPEEQPKIIRGVELE